MRFTIRIVAIAALALATACGSKSVSSGQDQPGGSSAANTNVLTAAEIAERGLGDRTLYDIIQLMRPNYFVFRGMSGTTANAGRVQVSFETASLSPLDDLRRVSGKDVLEVRYLSASSAAQRFGTTANSGPVITVRRK